MQVAAVFRRVADPEIREREEAAQRARAEMAEKNKQEKEAGSKRAGKKAGAWGGLP